MRECVVYARVSSKEQEREGFSIPAQLELFSKYAEKNNLKIRKEFIEIETARKTGRQQFTELLNYLANKKAPKVVLFEKTDRATRNFYDEVELDKLINDRDIEIHYVKEGEILSRNSSSHTMLLHRIKVAISENYVRNLSEEVKKGQKQKAMQGGWSWPAPYGYMKVDKELVPNPETAPFIRAAFRLYATGLYSVRRCASELLRLGYFYRAYQKKISDTSLLSMLTNRIYIGDIVTNGEIFKGIHYPIVDFSTWEKVQTSLQKKGKPIGEEKKIFTYRGMLICGSCGRNYVGEHKKGGRYTYYRCASVASKEGCTQRYINENLIDKALIDVFRQIYFTPEMKAEIREVFNLTDRLQENTQKEELAQIERQLKIGSQRIKKAYYDKLDGNISDIAWREIQAEYHNEQLSLEERKTFLRKTEVNYYDLLTKTFELPERLIQQWSSANIENRVRILNLVGSNLIANGQNVDVVLTPLFEFIYSLNTFKKWRGGRGSNPRHPA